MTRVLRSSKPASDEFVEAVRWYEEQRPGLGTEFYNAVTETTALIETHPEMGPPNVLADERRRIHSP